MITCPHCYVDVLPRSDQTCPACGKSTRRVEGADRSKRELSIYQDEPLPAACYLCTRETHTSDLVQTEKYDENDPAPTRNTSILLKILAGLMGFHLFFGRTKHPMVVAIKIPVCDACRSAGVPEPRHVDFHRHMMTFVVHKSFRAQVLRMRDARASES